MWRLPIQNNSKLPITEKRQNKAKYLKRNSVRLCKEVCKEDHYAKPLSKALECYSSSSSIVLSEDLLLIKMTWKHTGYMKKVTFLWGINKAIKVVVFHSRPLPNILKYRDQRWDLPAIWKTKLPQTYIE